MIVIENECVDCGYPCIYEACRFYRVVRYYCDLCGEEADLWRFDGHELCAECILKQLEEVTYND